MAGNHRGKPPLGLCAQDSSPLADGNPLSFSLPEFLPLPSQEGPQTHRSIQLVPLISSFPLAACSKHVQDPRLDRTAFLPKAILVYFPLWPDIPIGLNLRPPLPLLFEYQPLSFPPCSPQNYKEHNIPMRLVTLGKETRDHTGAKLWLLLGAHPSAPLRDTGSCAFREQRWRSPWYLSIQNAHTEQMCSDELSKHFEAPLVPAVFISLQFSDSKVFDLPQPRFRSSAPCKLNVRSHQERSKLQVVSLMGTNYFSVFQCFLILTFFLKKKKSFVFVISLFMSRCCLKT